MPHATPRELAASAARTSSGEGASVDLGVDTTLLLDLTVTATSGTTPSLLVTLETSAEGSVWRTLGQFASKTATGRERLRFPGADRYVRARWTLGGTTPSFTFSVAGSSLRVFATPEELRALGAASEALAAYTDAQLDERLCAVTDTMSGYLQARYSLPLATWGADLKQAVVDRAVYDVLSHRGFNPADNPLVAGRAREALRWLEDVRDERIDPVGLVDSTPDVYDSGAFVSSLPLRGWGNR